MSISYFEILEILVDGDRDIDLVVDVIATNRSDITKDGLDEFKNFLISTFMPHFKSKWNETNRKKSRFIENHQAWLSNEYSFTDGVISQQNKRGRPFQSFDLCQTRAKRNKVQQLCESVPAELMSSVAVRVTKDEKRTQMFSLEKAVSLILDAKLSKYQYEILRQSAKEIGSDIFPPYYQVLAAKKKVLSQKFRNAGGLR